MGIRVRTGILVATDEEATPLHKALGLRPWGLLSGFPFWGSGQWAMVRSGMGPKQAARAARALVKVADPQRILITGVCGGLSPEMEAGQMILAEQSDPEWLAAASRQLPMARVGQLLSQARVVADRHAKQVLHEETGALAVDMETAGAIQELSLPWLGFRVVSDGPDFDMPLDFSHCVDQDGLPDYRAIAVAATKAPASLPRLLRLARNTRRATMKMVEAVPLLL